MNPTNPMNSCCGRSSSYEPYEHYEAYGPLLQVGDAFVLLSALAKP